MKKIDFNEIKEWAVAKKTRPIKARPLISLLVDRAVANKFLVDTLEGREPLGDGAVICIGESNDIWQQMPNKLLKKYDVVDIDKDGWMICQPKPDNSVNVVEVYDEDEFYVIGHWGEKTEEGFIQKGKKGDFICRSREDATDVWVVARKIFLNTYNFITT